MAMDIEKKIYLKRQLGYFWGTNFLIINIIGAGIFVSPKGVLQYSSMNVGVSLCVWVFCAVLSMTSTLCAAEIGITFPYTVAHYYFLKRCFGPFVAFLRLWTSLFTGPGVLASQALLLAEYGIQPFYPSCSAPAVPKKCLALAMLWIVGILNSRGVKELSWLQTVSMVLKMGILSFISLSGLFLLVTGRKENVRRLQNAFDAEFPEVSRLIEAIFQGYFAFSGGGSFTYVAAWPSWTHEVDALLQLQDLSLPWQLCAAVALSCGALLPCSPQGIASLFASGQGLCFAPVLGPLGELKEPSKTIPRCIFTALPLVTVVYLLANLSYLTVLSPQELLSSDAVALTWTDRVIPQLTWSVPFAISASLFSNLVTSVFETSRTSYIASRNGQLPLLCSTLNVHSSPFIAVLLDVSMGSIAIVLTNLIELINYLFFVFSIWTVLSVIGILKLRYQEPNLHRPYKVFSPFLFITAAISLSMVLIPLIKSPKMQYIYVFLFFLGGLLFYVPLIHFKLKLIWFQKLTCYLQLLFNICIPDVSDEHVAEEES
ncbi:solute carrier family 7 member 13 isoform X1 [Rattus norvegicus]|uniref:solute carrier family 7 member 13 isoform X1 n=1 Tax=Rattus norvegicus TaxID=10116 RepID=UPI002FD7EE22